MAGLSFGKPQAALVRATFAGYLSLLALHILIAGRFSLPLLLGTLLLALLNTRLIVLLYPAKPVRPKKRVGAKAGATVADSTLEIATATLPYMRQGLNPETAGTIAAIIQKISDVPAVAITDAEKVLAFLGEGCQYHPPGGYIVTNATKEVITTGELRLIEKREDFNCPRHDCDCPLGGAVIAPLVCRGKTVGTIKLYKTDAQPIPLPTIKLASGLSQLLGMQLELAELDHQAQLATKAELDALQAQINPHFLFNTLNTITMFIRTNPDVARHLLLRLAAFLRHSLKRRGGFITLSGEIEYIENYVALEQARFEDRIRMVWDIDPGLLDACIPVLTVQPLVENAIRHGLTPRLAGGTVTVAAHRQDGILSITVTDDGVGIQPEAMPRLFVPGYDSGNGVAMNNVQERVKLLFGRDYGLQVSSTPGEGTRVEIRLPLVYTPKGKEELTHEAQSSAG